MFSFTFRSTFYLFLRLIAAGAILWYVFTKYGGKEIFIQLGQASPAWVITAGLFFLISIVAGAWQWHLLLEYQGVDYGLKRSFQTYYAGMFLNNFLPTTMGGDALRVYEVRKGTDLLGKGLAATFFDRLLGFSALSVFSFLAVIFLLWNGELPPYLARVLLLLVSFVCATFSIVLLVLLSKHISQFISMVFSRLGMERLTGFYVKLQGYGLQYRSRRKELIGIWFLAAFVQILRICVHWFSAQALGIDVPVLYFFCFVPLIALAGIVPINIGGWGIPQQIGAALYSLPHVLPPGLNASESDAAAASLSVLPTLIGTFVMLFGGFYFVMGIRHAKKGMAEL